MAGIAVGIPSPALYCSRLLILLGVMQYRWEGENVPTLIVGGEEEEKQQLHHHATQKISSPSSSSSSCPGSRTGAGTERVNEPGTRPPDPVF